MRIDDIGYHHKHDSSFLISRPDGAGDWLFLVVKTKAVFRIDGVDIPVQPNAVIVYTPEYPQYYHADGGEYIDDWIHFGYDPEEEQLMHELGLPFNKVMPLSDITQVSNIVRNMCYEHYSANKNRKQTVDLYFRMLLYKLNEGVESYSVAGAVNESKYFEKLLWLRESIYRWPAREWNVDDMAEEISLSRSRLQHLYSDTFGVSISKDIITSRMDKAKDLLKNPELPVSRISAMVGYSNPSYFNKQFRNAFGITPSEFRQQFFETIIE
ncbi:MAG: helix-turn-helix transcriptional regulator [Ruminococcus sp.]|nr:helix-turn-helix transcriptional regulator [Ruminococcus sp.]